MSSPDTPSLTTSCLEQRRELVAAECALYGHDIEYVHQGWSRDPKAAFCGRGCGHPGWVMVPADQPRLWRSVAPAISRALEPYPGARDAVNAAVAAVLEPGQVLR